MPMAGEGSRFVSKGFTTPKPLLLHQNEFLFTRAMRSIEEITVPLKTTFIVRKEHIERKHSLG
jgi:hypothetical protein